MLIDPVTTSYLQICALFICSVVSLSLVILILRKNSKNILNRLFSSGFFGLTIGCLGAVASNIPYSTLVVFGNKIFWISISACLLAFFIGALYVAYGNFCFNPKYLAIYVILFLLPIIVLIDPNSLLDTGDYGEYTFSEIATVIVYPLMAFLLIGTTIVFYMVYRHNKVPSIKFFLLGMIVNLIALVTAAIAALLEQRLLDTLGVLILTFGFIMLYRGFSIKSEA